MSQKIALDKTLRQQGHRDWACANMHRMMCMAHCMNRPMLPRDRYAAKARAVQLYHPQSDFKPYCRFPLLEQTEE
jgi:hypothetical protein